MLVSIYLATRNRAALLPLAVESVLAQSHRDLELVVVNDGSTDATEGYLEALAARDARVRVLHNETSLDLCVSRNRAIQASHGEFVTGIDDDDQFTPGRIKGFLDYWSLLEENGEQFSLLYSQDIIRRGGRLQRTEKAGSASFAQMFRRNIIGNQFFVRRATLMELGGFDETLVAWGDVDLYLRVLERYGPGRLFDVATYLFDDEPRPGRLSGRKLDRIRLGYRAVAKKHSAVSRRMKQELLLQVFSDFYGFRPGISDMREFFGYGFDLRNFMFLCKALLQKQRHRPH